MLQPNLTCSEHLLPLCIYLNRIPDLSLHHGGSSITSIYDQSSTSQGYYLAKEEKVFFAGKLQADMSLDVIETLKNPGMEIVSPPWTPKPSN